MSQLLHAVCYEPSDAKAKAALELAKIASERLRESQQNCGLTAPGNSATSTSEPDLDAEVDFPEVRFALLPCLLAIRLLSALEG